MANLLRYVKLLIKKAARGSSGQPDRRGAQMINSLGSYVIYTGSMQPVYSSLYNIPWLTGVHFLDKFSKIDTIGTIIHTVYENVLHSKRISLSSHHLYGSSRLGTKDYLAGQYYMLWDYSGPQTISDTATLLTRRPWYSSEYNDVISGLALQPWGMTEMSAFLVNHQVGQKQYELTNHLGNVQATVSDLPSRYAAQAGDTVRQHFPALVTAYDYYPFGMLMPGRGTDSISGISSSQGNILIEATDFSDNTTQGWQPYSIPLSVENGRLKMHATGRWQGTYRNVNLIPGRQYRVKFDIDIGNTTGRYFSVWNNTRLVLDFITQSGPKSYTITMSWKK